MAGLPKGINADISIHVPREGHDYHSYTLHGHARISIHVPREGHDDNIRLGIEQTEISIHVPREGHDTPLFGHCPSDA